MTDKSIPHKLVVAAFDFDGTITYRDTFFPFLIRAFGLVNTLCVCLFFLPEVLVILLRGGGRDSLKAALVRRLFKGRSLLDMAHAGDRYAFFLERCIRLAAKERILWHKQKGHRLVMVSASIDVYLKQCSKFLGFDDLLCTSLSHDGHVFMGEFIDGNCRGKNKVKKLEILLGDLNMYDIYVYGDSSGDKEMLEVANHPYYRPFR